MSKNIEKIDIQKQENLEKKIDSIAYNFLKKYSQKKETIDKLMRFETSKGIEEFKKTIDSLKKSGEIKNEIKVEEIFITLNETKNKIKNLTIDNLTNLKSIFKKNEKYKPNSHFDIAEKIKNKNIDLYNKITNPEKVTDHFISGIYGSYNSLSKIGNSIIKLTIDFIKTITLQINKKEIIEKIKRV